MHMSDALISVPVALSCAAAAGGLVGWAARRVACDPDHDRRLPLMGVLGAFVFAAQMINFAIPGTGSSGHIGGGLLLAVLLGPWASILVMASVLIVQCLLFADGGLLALGCNILNLGLWPALIGLPVYQFAQRSAALRRVAALPAVLAVSAALALGALGVVVETVLSGRSELPFGPFALIMLGIHLPIAVGEGLLTAGVLAALRRLAVATPEAPTLAPRRAAALLLVCALVVGGTVAWFASSAPDGLEWSVARVSGHDELPAPATGAHAAAAAMQDRTALLPEYALPAPAGDHAKPAVEAWPAISAGTSLAGVIGALVVLLAVLVIGLGLRAWRPRRLAISG